MDWDSVFFRIFGNVMSTDRAVREAAENELAHVSEQESNLLLYLLQYCTRNHSGLLGPSPDPSVARNVFVSKLGAAIRFRNVVTKSDWNRNPYFTEVCKGAVRATIVQLLCQPHVEDKIRKQLAAATKSLVTYDYLTGLWSELPGYLNAVLTAVVPATGLPTVAGLYSLFGMLTVARHTCKVYENPTLVTPRATDEFASFMVPLLLQLSQRLLQIATQTVSSIDLHCAVSRPTLLCLGEFAGMCSGCQRLVLKCLSSIILPRWPLVLCEVQRAQTLFGHVGELWTFFCASLLPLFDVLLRSAAEGMRSQQAADDAVRFDPQWKLGKWVGKVSDRLIELLSVPSHCEKRARASAKAFLDSGFSSNVASAAISCILWHDDRDKSGRFLTSKLLVLCIEIVEHLVVFEPAYTGVVVRHVEQLLTAVLPARLSFTLWDEELWTSNPEEYVRQLSDPRGDLFNPKIASMSLIVSLCIPSKPFHRNDLLFHYINQLLHVLQNHAQQQHHESHRAVDGCLFAITNLKRCLSTADFGDDKVEWLLVTYVSPLLSSSCGFLRARAVFTLSQFAGIAWAHVKENFYEILRRVLAMLDDPETPVRIQAASSLSRFIRLEISRPVVTPCIATIVEKYFALMRQADHDGVIRTLRKTIKFYGDTLTTWAVQLCGMLVNQFWNLHLQIQHRRGEIEQEIDRNKEGAEADGDGEDGTMQGDVADVLQAGDELIATLETLVECVPTHHDTTTMVRLQEVIVPMLVSLMELRNEGAFGFMDSVLQLLTTLISRSLAVAPVTWTVVETLHRLVEDGATDYFSQLLAPLDNLLSVDPRTFCCSSVTQSGAVPAKMVLVMCQKVLHATHLRCREIAAVPCVADAILLHIKQLTIGAAQPTVAYFRDELVVPFVSMALGALGSSTVTVRTLKVLFAGNVLSAMWAMPHDTVALLVSMNALEFFFASYVALLSEPEVLHVLREYDCHLFVLAVSEVMLVPDAAGCVVSLLQSPLLAHLVKTSATRYEGEIKARKEDKFTGSDVEWDEDDEDTDSEGGFEADEEGLDDDELIMDEEPDDEIEDDDKFREVLAAAAAHREADLDEDPDENLLDDDDFTSPIDDLSPWQHFYDASLRVINSGPSPLSQWLSQHTELAAAMHGAAVLWHERFAMRQASAEKKQSIALTT
jgi:hypothetical protein